MRNTKIWLVLLLAVVMLVSNLGVTAMATENESPLGLYVSPAAEGIVQVNILSSQAQIVADGKLVVTYDPEVLTYVDTQPGDAWSDPEQVTLSVNPDSGKIILAFASIDASKDGTLFTLTFSGAVQDTVIAVDGSSSYITGVGAVKDLRVDLCPSAQYVDMQNMVPVIHEAVDYMVGMGYMNGMSGTMFGPNVELNRAMMVTILYRIAGAPAVEEDSTFTDVPAGVFYTAPVAWAVENGITNGVSANLFAPDKSLTRQELVTFLHRFAKYMQYDVTKTTDLSVYTDADKVQPYAVEAFEWAVASGVINGTSATTLSPENTTTRAQVCIMVSRLLKAQD